MYFCSSDLACLINTRPLQVVMLQVLAMSLQVRWGRSRCGSRDDEERAKRQRTEQTEMEMEVRQGQPKNPGPAMRRLKLENINHRDAAMFRNCELRTKVILTRCNKRSQLESTWDLCQAQIRVRIRRQHRR